MDKIQLKKKSVQALSILIGIFSILIFALGILGFFGVIENQLFSKPANFIASFIISLLLGIIAYGLWFKKDWSRSMAAYLAILIILYILISAIFEFSSIVFAGKQVTPLSVISKTFIDIFIIKFLLRSSIPIAIILVLRFLEEVFNETQTYRNTLDKVIRYILFITALSSILIVALIFVFTFSQSTEAISKIGVKEMLTGTIWRPGSIIGNDTAQFGLLPMILGSIYSTIGAILIGVPLSIGTAILLAEIASPLFRSFLRPAVELLAGIPSVIYGLFGMIVIAPLIRHIEIDGNSGFGILNASIILAIMILPTITNITEDAIRAVPDSYRQASLALGATKWQTIKDVIIPAARSGIIAAIILGIGRALGETMALIMVIGNAINIPKPLNNNPLTVVLSAARTLTGNIAVEINYAEGVHRSALFFTGVVLFLLLLIINQLAHLFMSQKKSA